MTDKQQASGKPRRPRSTPTLQNPAAMKAARLDAGLGVRELARRAGVSFGHLGAVERGDFGASPEFIKRVADALGKPMKAFLNAEAAGQPVIDLMDKGAPAGSKAQGKTPGRQPNAA